jgi:integrase/recombinase XerD
MGILKENMINEMKLFGYSQKTISMYIKYMTNYSNFYQKSPLIITQFELKSFFLNLIAQNKAPTTLHNYYCALKFFYKINNRPYYMDIIPPPKVPFTIPAVLAQSEVQQILDLCKSLRYKTIFALIYSSGVRISEAANLQLSDIDFNRNMIHIHCSKNNKDRYTILSQKTSRLLKKYINHYKPKTFLFFCLKNNEKALPPRQIQFVFHSIIKELPFLKNVHVHTLRHSFATHLLENNTNIFYIMKLLGHSNLSSTLIYLHMQRIDLLKIVSPLDSSNISLDGPTSSCFNGQYLLSIA